MKQRTRTAVIIVCIAVLVLTAAVLRAAARQIENPFADKLFTFTRTFLYIGLIAAWGISVRARVVQRYARRVLSLIAVMMLFWIAVREVKYRFILSPDVIRYLWYSYYIPILMIPVLALSASFAMGQPEGYRPPKKRLLLYMISLLLIGLVMTNDLHRLVFSFRTGAPWDESNYRHGAGFFIAVGWVLMCAVSAIVIMLRRSRAAVGRRGVWMPLLPCAAAVIHMPLYIMGVPFVSMFLDDMAVFDCLIFMAFFESCIACGLIQTNTRYTEFFRASDTPIRIVDSDLRTVYAADSCEPITKQEIRGAIRGEEPLTEGRRLHAMPIRGGYVVWTEDISRLLKVARELEDTAEELRERNELLSLEYEREREHQAVEEQNRLYDLLQRKTQRQIDRIDRLVDAYASQTPDRQRGILARILVLGSYIKRRKNFILSVAAEAEDARSLLHAALDESYRSLRTMGISGGYLVNIGSAADQGRSVEAYDFFEAVVESVMDRAQYLNTRVTTLKGELRAVITTDTMTVSEGFLSDYPSARIISDEDGVTYLLTIGGGDA